MLEALLAVLLVLALVLTRRYQAFRAPRVDASPVRRAGRDRGLTVRSVRPGLSRLAALLSVVGFITTGGLNRDPSSTVRTTDATRGATISVKDAPYNAVGDGVTDDLPAIQAALDAVASAGSPYGVTVLLPPGTYRVSGSIRVRRGVALVGAGIANTYTASLIVGDAGVTCIIMDGPASSSDGGRSDWSVVQGLNISQASKSGTAHGIFMQAHGAKVRDCAIGGCSGDGVHIVGNTGASPSTNANGWELTNLRIDTCSGSGVFVSGSDANAGCAILVDSSSNGQYGFWDQSFLGNTYVGCHGTSNTLGTYKVDDGSGGNRNNARNVFLGCYSESGQPASDIRSTATMVIGGLHGASFTTTTTAQLLVDGAWSASIKFPDTTGAKTVTFYPSVGEGNENMSRWQGGADHAAGLSFRYDFPAPGWYGFIHANSALRPVLAMSGNEAAEGPGLLWFPIGGFFGNNNDGTKNRIIMGTAAPTTGTWVRGDRVINSAPVAAGTEGWVCVTAGTPGTWKTFGSIAP